MGHRLLQLRLSHGIARCGLGVVQRQPQRAAESELNEVAAGEAGAVSGDAVHGLLTE